MGDKESADWIIILSEEEMKDLVAEISSNDVFLYSETAREIMQVYYDRSGANNEHQ